MGSGGLALLSCKMFSSSEDRDKDGRSHYTEKHWIKWDPVKLAGPHKERR
jgi:hypothetical protein